MENNQKRGQPKPEKKLTLEEVVRWIEASEKEATRCHQSTRERLQKINKQTDGITGLYEAKGLFEGKMKAYRAVLDILKVDTTD